MVLLAALSSPHQQQQQGADEDRTLFAAWLPNHSLALAKTTLPPRMVLLLQLMLLSTRSSSGSPPSCASTMPCTTTTSTRHWTMLLRLLPVGYAEPITDAEYDALAAREAELCQAHPELWHRLQAESGLGPRATRYKGRVGAVHDASSDDDEEEEDVVVASSMAAEINSTNRLKQAHLKPMLSLDNVHDTDQLVAWLERVRKKLLAEAEGEEEETTTVTIVTEPKLDGLSLSLRYELISPDDGGGDSSYYELKWACTRGDGRKGTDVTRAVREMGTVPTRFRMEGEATEATRRCGSER